MANLPKFTDSDHREHPPFPTPQSVGERFFALQKNKLAPYRATKVYLWRTDCGWSVFPAVFPVFFSAETLLLGEVATYLHVQKSS
ncbi:hypothetical protein [Parapedobacter composti]|uniref:hypothetical protein n=1 Tax=Parapedobacter composti TaxID=623281 RepID=UPI000B8827DC|nr:hypothetical protein [Parapedobacter composti]